MSDTKPKIPFESSVMPEVLGADHKIRFRCHQGISCFNECCRHADVTLAPYDILRLKKRLDMTSSEFLERYTVPFQMDGDGLPGVKLKTLDAGPCSLLDDATGCTVYADRPTVCRYYPLALLSMRPKDAPEAEQYYSMVREDHCQGHDEDRTLTIAEYRQEQRCEELDDLNREWYRIILKKKSAGPAVGRPPRTSLQLFFMVSYDLDRFRTFVLSENFNATYRLEATVLDELKRDDVALMKFGYRFLRQVLFAEHTIPERKDAWEKRVGQRQEVWDARRQDEIARREKEQEERYKDA